MEALFLFILEHVFELIAMLFTIVGGGFALCQWKKSNDYKRAELVQKLIDIVRDDDEVLFVLSMIDWDEGFFYDGKFHINEDILKTIGNDYPQEKIVRTFEKTLAYFSYICYLKEQSIFNKSDISMFEYLLRRIFDNPSIRNYLYSLYHWSKSINVNCSYEYLIRYALEKEYLKKDFLIYSRKGIGDYKSYILPLEEYEDKFK